MEFENLESHIRALLNSDLKSTTAKVPRDYFNWGKDKRHIIDDTETLPSYKDKSHKFDKLLNKLLVKFTSFYCSETLIMCVFKKKYSSFCHSYKLMSDDYSRQLFAELVLIKIISEKNMRLSSFSKEFVEAYEDASAELLKSEDIYRVYKWVLRKATFEKPNVQLYTTPIICALHESGRLYSYNKNGVAVKVEQGDVIIDAGIGWGDTTVYLGALSDQEMGGHSYAFDILETGIKALRRQLAVNDVSNITPVLKALSDISGEYVNITDPSPGARITSSDTDTKVETISVDSFVENERIERVDFIKMDIEGAEIPAIVGASKTIKSFKPKLAISVYHKWDDLERIPSLINTICDSYDYYLDCTTGFGGEAVLYCK